MKKKKIQRPPRIPIEGVELLRHKGGAHSSPKGKRGYDKNKEKEKLRRSFD